jgi:hypothetical protein
MNGGRDLPFRVIPEGDTLSFLALDFLEIRLSGPGFMMQTDKLSAILITSTEGRRLQFLPCIEIWPPVFRILPLDPRNFR